MKVEGVMRGLLSASHLERGRRKQGRRTSSHSGLWRTITRVLSPAALLALAIPSLALGQTNNEGLPLIPLQIVNNYNSAQSLYVYIHGILPTATPNIPAGSSVYVSDVKGDIAIMPQILPQGTYQSLALNVGTGQSITMMFPQLSSVRIYVSSGKGLQVCCNAAVGSPPSEPIGWSSNEPNYNTPFDWAELNWGNLLLGGNVTQVDMFGLPLLLTLKGKSTTGTSNAGFPQRFQTIMSAYQALGAPWTQLIVNDSNNKPLRVISPYHGIQNGVFPSNALDAYISQVFSFYQSNSLAVTASCSQDGYILHTLSGSTSGGALAFSEGGTPRFQFAQPSTLTVYTNEIQANPTPASPLYDCLSEVVAAKLGAAFIRTNLLANTNLDACNTSQFYVNDPIQRYAQLFHIYAVNHLAYSFPYDDTCGQSSYITIDDPTSMTITVGGRPTATHDFNGDGLSDIAWRNTNGDTALWLMTVNPSGGAQILSSMDYGKVPTSWTIVGQRDFNGDGKADLLWSNTNGDTAIWLMNGTQVIATPDLGVVGNGWSIVGTGDFNGDGYGDIVWRNLNGDTSIWLMTGTATQVQVLAVTDLGIVPPSWSVAQTGDFNGDGKADILWRNMNGDASIWLMTANGTQMQVLSVTDLGVVPTSWNVMHTGDFNGDGKSDILWHNSNGNSSIWLMTANGTQVQVLSTNDLGFIPPSWNVALTGDFNGDGMSDILWSNTNGDTSIWFMTANGTQVQVLSISDLGIVPTSWVVQGAGAD
jgi:hypothetical protein